MLNGEEKKLFNASDIDNIEQGPFTDPVVRCDSCSTIIKATLLRSLGSCSTCGNKRVRDVTVFDQDEYDQIKAWGFTDFLACFEVVPDE